MRRWLSFTLASLVSTPVVAADLAVTVEIPRIDVAEYHRPYVAIWIERTDQSVVSTLAVWYDVTQKQNEGTRWLKDLRQWWRKSGRALSMPIDGVSGATRAAGRHTVTFSSSHAAMAALAPGHYHLVVEAAREVGGRELVRVPLQWPATRRVTANAAGTSELGALRVTVTP